MNRRGLLALAVLLVLSIGLMTGCSQAEMGFVNLMNEMNELDVFESEETLAISINQLPGSISQGGPANAAFNTLMLSKYSLKYTIRMDAKKGVFDGDLFLVDTASGTEQQILSYIGNGDTFYFKIDDLVAFAKSFNNPKIDQQLAILGDASYISISAGEMAELSGDPNMAMALDFSQIKKQQDLYRKLMNGLTQDVFDEYQAGLVSKNNNQYTLSVDKQDVLDNMVPFLTYSIDNIEKLSSFATDFLNGLDAQEMAMLSLTPEMKQQALDAIGKTVPDIATNRDQYLAQINALAATAEQGMAVIGDQTNMTIVSEKVAPGEFTQKASVRIEVADPAAPSEVLDISLEANTTARTIEPFTVDIPTSGVVSITELSDKMPQVLTIDTVYERYVFTHGLRVSTDPIDVEIIGGSIFLPLRDTAAILSENIGWDPALKQAYVLKDGKNIELESVVKGGLSFVKLRELEKLGYTVTWDSFTKTAGITQ